MAGQRAVDLALDLARMPEFASSMAASPLPVDVLEVIRIAAESPDACRAAVLATGQPEPVLVEAARFYVQQILFRPEADCYRVLGIRPDDSRELARVHMRWLLQWLHPDHNGGWDAIYAKRIVKAWREVSTGSGMAGNSRPTAGGAESHGRANNQTRRFSASLRLPLIKRPIENAWCRRKLHPRFLAAAVIAAGLVTILLVLGLTAPASGSNSALSDYQCSSVADPRLRSLIVIMSATRQVRDKRHDAREPRIVQQLKALRSFIGHQSSRSVEAFLGP